MKKLSLLLLSMMSIFFLTAQTPGTLDLSFGDNGLTLVDFGGSSNHCFSSAIQPDQKIVMAGYTFNSTKDMSFARLNTDGTLDPGFGIDGIITPVFGATEEQMNDVIVQPNGFILGTGYTYDGDESEMIAIRLTPIGLFDPTFSNDGMVVIDFGFIEDSWGHGIALQNDGKIVLAGHLRDNLFDLQCGIARLNPDGSIDNSFGTNGVVIKDFASMDNYINNVAMQGDKIVVGGISFDDDDDFHVTIARFTTDGIADPSFGVNGYISSPLNIDPSVFSAMGAMCIDAENHILFGVYSEDADEGDFAIYKYLPDGEPDMNFGIDGELIIELPGWNSIKAITTQYDNKIIATGWSDTGGTPIVRLMENGDLDPSFGTAGTGVVYNGTLNYIYSLNIQDDGLIIAAGEAYNGSDLDFAAARFHSGSDVGISSFDHPEINMSIYPNPAQNQIQINIPPGKEITEVRIYNQLGQQLIYQKEGTGYIDISTLIPGFYEVEVWMGNTRVVESFIKSQ